jgi:hypothetical protein
MNARVPLLPSKIVGLALSKGKRVDHLTPY